MQVADTPRTVPGGGAAAPPGVWVMKNTSLSLHSAFNRVLNYADEEGRILSLVLPEIGGGPGHVIVKRLPEPAPALVVLNEGELIVGEETVRLGDQPEFDPYPDVWEWPSSETIRKGVANILPLFPSGSPVFLLERKPGGRSATALPARGGFGNGRAGPPDPPEQGVSRTGSGESGACGARALPAERSGMDFNRALYAELEKGAGSLVSGDVEAGARTLKGLGPGLTPTGDDILCGFLWALALADRIRRERFKETRGTILEIARGENLIVNHFLTAAANGLFFDRFKCFVEAFLNGDAPRIRSAFTPLLDIGETSGADTVVGFIMGLEPSEGIGG